MSLKCGSTSSGTPQRSNLHSRNRTAAAHQMAQSYTAGAAQKQHARALKPSQQELHRSGMPERSILHSRSRAAAASHNAEPCTAAASLSAQTFTAGSLQQQHARELNPTQQRSILHGRSPIAAARHNSQTWNLEVEGMVAGGAGGSKAKDKLSLCSKGEPVLEQQRTDPCTASMSHAFETRHVLGMSGHRPTCTSV